MAARPKVVFADVMSKEFAARWKNDLSDLPIDLQLILSDSEEEMKQAISGAKLLIVKRKPVDAALLELAGPELKVVAKLSHWPLGVDLVACEQRGVTVEMLPQLSGISVAEQAMMLILACARTLVPGHLGTVNGSYRDHGLEPAVTAERSFAFKWLPVKPFEVFEKTLGIIGYGEIGMELTTRARGFGMNVIYNKRTRLDQDTETSLGVSYRSLDDLVAESDFISLHSPHTPETDKLLGRKQFEMMKSTAFVINTARGGEIDEEALVNALKTGQIAGAGLDVFVEEPVPYDHPLLSLDNVVTSPHIGGGSGTGRVDAVRRVKAVIETVLS